eukprot:m.119747 g.119747  ORF g.119747 m.119747 type:complete len:728 (-) comp14330_c0_seq1:77-2260(-)
MDFFDPLADAPQQDEEIESKQANYSGKSEVLLANVLKQLDGNTTEDGNKERFNPFFTNDELEGSGEQNIEDALRAWNLSQYGIANINHLSDVQLRELRKSHKETRMAPPSPSLDVGGEDEGEHDTTDNNNDLPASTVNQMAINTENVLSGEYISFQTHLLDEPNSTRMIDTESSDESNQNAGQNADVGSTLGSWLGGWNILSSNEEPKITIEESDSAPLEGFVCPVCLIDMRTQKGLEEHFNRAHGEPDSDNELVSNQEEGQNDNDINRAVSGIIDASKAWANAVPNYQLRPRTDSQRTQSSTNSSSIRAGIPRPMASLQEIRANREMFCLRCQARKTEVTDVFCEKCGKPHLNRVEQRDVPLSLQKASSPGYGFSFKNHTIYKVKPASPAENGGMRVGDKLREICGVNISEIDDHSVLDMIKQAAPVLNVVVLRNFPAPPAHDREASFPDDDDENIFNDLSQTPPGGRLVFEGMTDNESTSETTGIDEPQFTKGNLSARPRSVSQQSACEETPARVTRVTEKEISTELRDSTYMRMLKERLERTEKENFELSKVNQELSEKLNSTKAELDSLIQLQDEDPKDAKGQLEESSDPIDLVGRQLKNALLGALNHVGVSTKMNMELEELISENINACIAQQTAADAQAQFVTQNADPDDASSLLASRRLQVDIAEASERKQTAETAVQSNLLRSQESLENVGLKLDQVNKFCTQILTLNTARTKQNQTRI